MAGTSARRKPAHRRYIRKRSGDRNRRKSSAGLRKLVCVVERRRARARVLFAPTSDRTPPLPRASPAIGSGGIRSNGSVQRRSAPSDVSGGETKGHGMHDAPASLKTGEWRVAV